MNRISYITKRLSLVIFALCIFAPVWSQSSADIRSYIARFKQAALEQEKAYGVPASITLAQGILESGAGKSGLTRIANNHFGIKALGGWTGKIYQAWDDEPQKSRFRWYNSASESYRDHSLFLRNNSRYRSLFSKSVYDYRGWAIGLQKAGYATAKNYASALIGFIDCYQLYAVNGGVKLRAGKTVTIKRYVKEKPVFDEDCQLDEDEESEEQEVVKKAVQRFVVEINEVRCTILYPGETISSVAMRYDIPKKKILEFNEVTSEQDFHEGDIVFLAKKKSKFNGAQDYYRVKPDDTLYSIAQNYGIKLVNLAKMNDKDFFSSLREGERIRLK